MGREPSVFDADLGWFRKYSQLAAELRAECRRMPPSRERDLLVRLAADCDHAREAVVALTQTAASSSVMK